MQRVHHDFRGLHLLMDLNWDRLLYIGTLAAALGCGALLGGFLH